MKTRGRRPDQVAEQVRQVVAEALLADLADPRIRLVTVTGVEVTNDLSLATVRVSIMGSDQERSAALAGLASATGFLRRRVGQALSARITPELRFVLDEGLAHTARIEQILGELRRERGD